MPVTTVLQAANLTLWFGFVVEETTAFKLLSCLR